MNVESAKPDIERCINPGGMGPSYVGHGGDRVDMKGCGLGARTDSHVVDSDDMDGKCPETGSPPVILTCGGEVR